MIVELASAEAVEAAWDAYAKQAARLADRPELLRDRAFNEQLARLHERWKRLFLIQEAAK